MLLPEKKIPIGFFKKSNKPVLLEVNKVDSPGKTIASAEFHAMGFDPLFYVSALHDTGVGDLMEKVIGLLSGPSDSEDHARLRICFSGRPSVGKSSWFNRMIGEKQSIVHSTPGTTGDSILHLIFATDNFNLDVDPNNPGFNQSIKELDQKKLVKKGYLKGELVCPAARYPTKYSVEFKSLGNLNLDSPKWSLIFCTFHGARGDFESSVEGSGAPRENDLIAEAEKKGLDPDWKKNHNRLSGPPPSSSIPPDWMQLEKNQEDYNNFLKFIFGGIALVLVLNLAFDLLVYQPSRSG